MKVVAMLLLMAVAGLADEAPPPEHAVPEEKPAVVPQVQVPQVPVPTTYVYPYVYPYVRYPLTYYPEFYPPGYFYYPTPTAKALWSPYKVEAPVGASTQYGVWQ